MQRLLLLLLASLFLMAMKCGPAPCQPGEAFVEINVNSWASFSQEGVDSIRSIISFPNGKTDTGMFNVNEIMQYDDYGGLEAIVCKAWKCQVDHYWVDEDSSYIASHDDSVTLPAHVNIAFIGNGEMLDSIGFSISADTQTDLFLYKDSERLSSWSEESVLDSGCVKNFCWITHHIYNRCAN